MAKTASVALSADVRGFKQQVEEAKKALGSLGKAKMSPDFQKQVAAIFSTQLQKQASGLESQISSLTDQLRELASVGQDSWDSKRILQVSASLDTLKGKLKGVVDLQKQVGQTGGASDKMVGGGASGGGIGSSLMRGGMGAFGKVLGAVGVGLGVSSLINKREQIADERLKILPLTTDNKMGSERSGLGYGPSERRDSMARMASQTQVSGNKLSALTDLGEQLERGYGVSRDQSADAIGTARRSGVDDQGKFLAESVGTAVAAKLEGSQIGQYMSAMTGYMESMSQGINVDTASLNGFAGALATLPFFKADPNRVFEAIRGLDGSFKSGDRFNQAQAARAIMRTPGAEGASAGAVEMRRESGLFSRTDPETIENLKKGGMGKEDLAALTAKPGDILKNMLSDIMSSSEGLSGGNRLHMFSAKTGLGPEASKSIYGKISRAQAEGKDGSDFLDKMAKEIEAATADPQKLAADRAKALAGSFDNMDGAVKMATASLERIGEDVTIKLADPMIRLANAIEKWGGKMGGTESGTGDALSIAAIGASIAALASQFGFLSKITSGVASAFSGIAGFASKIFGGGGAAVAGEVAGGAGAVAGAGLAGRIATRAIPVVGTAIALAQSDNIGQEDPEADYKRQQETLNSKEYQDEKDPAARQDMMFGYSPERRASEKAKRKAQGNAQDFMKNNPGEFQKMMKDSTYKPQLNMPSDVPASNIPVPSDRIPAVAGDTSALTHADDSSNVIRFSSEAVMKNTSAIMGLTNAIQGMRTGGQPSGRIPSNATGTTGLRNN